MPPAKLKVARPSPLVTPATAFFVKHQRSIRILPVDVLPDRLKRPDLHARQLQLSELLDPASRTFAAASELANLEAREEIDGLVKGAAFAERAAGGQGAGV
jgi:XRE family transcriptional regulator, fatty acid utilization regulator